MATGLGDEQLWLCPSLDDSADDLSGNGNHGTYNGSIGTVADTTSGGVRAYDGTTGTSDYVSVTWPNSNLTTRSMSVWIQPIGFGQYTNRQPISGPIKFANPGNTVAFRNQLNSYPWDANYPVASSANAHNSQWHCYTIVQDSSNTSVYVDGVFYATYTTNSNTNYGSGNGVFQIAREASYIDDFRVYERKLTQTEITHLATSRGIEGSPYDYNGLGDEKLWLCPSLDDSADDISGNGNHGTYNGGMGTVADTSNGGSRAYSFDGSNDYVETPFILNPASGDFSCTVWALLDSNAGYDVKIVQQLGSLGRTWMYKVGSALSSFLGGSYRGSGNQFTSSNHGTFQHFAMVYSGTSLKIYKDGTQVFFSQTVTAESESSGGMRFGAHKSTPAAYLWKGRMDDIRIFDRALTTSEITALASKRGYEVPSVSTTYHPFAALNHPLAQ